MERRRIMTLSLVLLLGLVSQSFAFKVASYTDYGTHAKYTYDWEANNAYSQWIKIGVDDGDEANYGNFDWWGGTHHVGVASWSILANEHEPKLSGVQTPIGSQSNGGVAPTTTTDYVLYIEGGCCSDYNGPVTFEYYGDGQPQDVGWYTSIDGADDWSVNVGTTGGPVWGPTPEPATVAILGLGSLVLLRRRR
jgi:hypothetical protein